MDTKYIRLGQIIRTHGLKGEVKCFSLTSFPKERFHSGRKLYVYNEKDGTREEVTVKSFRLTEPFYLVSFKEWESIEVAETKIRYYIEIEEKDAPLPEGFYRYQDLIGCEIINGENGEKLGVLKEVMTNAPTETFRIERENANDFFVPFVRNLFIKNIDIENKRITINVVPGML